jgi:O-antigen ligase
MPLIFSTDTIDPVLAPTFAFLSVVLTLVTVWLLINLIQRDGVMDPSVWWRRIFLFYGAYLLFCIISIVQSINLAEAVFELMRVLVIGVLLLLATALFSKTDRYDEILTEAFVVSGLVLSIICICQYFGLAFGALPQNGIPSGTMANKGLISSYLCLLLPFLFLGTIRRSTCWRVLALIALSSTLLVIVISQTRSTWVALIVAMAGTIPILLHTLWNRTDIPTRRNLHSSGISVPLIVVVLTVIMAGSGLFTGIGPNGLKDRAISIIKADDSSVSERLVLWRKMLQMFYDHPLSGVGVGNCKIVFPSYGIAGTLQESGEIFFQRPHNDYLWVLTETGVGGLIAYLLVFGAAIVYAVRIIRHGTREGALFAWAMLFAIVCYTTDSFFSFPKERITHLVILAIILAAVTTAYQSTFPPARVIRRRTVLIVLSSCLVISLASIGLGLIRIRSEIHTNLALTARDQANWLAVISEIDTARSPLASLDPTSTPLAWYRGVANWSLENIDRALSDFSLAYRDNPNHIHVLSNLAACYERKGDHGMAIDYYRKLLQMNPGCTDAILNLTAVFYNSGEYAEASATLSTIAGGCADPRYQSYRQRIAEKLETDTLGGKR